MRFLRYVDRKLTAESQKQQIKLFLFFGYPIGYLCVEIIKIIIFGWAKYNFSISNCIFTFILDVIIALPLIINYFLHKRKYKQIINKIKDKSDFNVKALFDFQDFKKGQSYPCYFDEILNKGKYSFTYYVCIKHNTNGWYYWEIELKNVINKFELDDIKDDRLKKLKKINKQPWYKINK